MARRRSGWRLGTVADLARDWGLEARLQRASHMGQAYIDCLDSDVHADGRAMVMAGKALPCDKRIVLHAELLKDGREVDRDATFLHECAHVIADRRYGRACKHGPLWRATIVTLGELPVAHHDIPYLSRDAHAKVIWRCTSCGETYPFVRKPKRRIRDCFCRHCGEIRGILVEHLPDDLPNVGRI